MSTRDKIDEKESKRERLVERLNAHYSKADEIKRKIGVLDSELRELYQKDKNERGIKTTWD